MRLVFYLFWHYFHLLDVLYLDWCQFFMRKCIFILISGFIVHNHGIIAQVNHESIGLH